MVRSRLVVRPPATSALYLKLWTCKKTVLAAPAPSRLAARVSSPLPSEPMCTPVPFHLNETQYTCKFIGTSRTQAVGRGGVWWPRGVRDRAGGSPPGPRGGIGSGKGRAAGGRAGGGCTRLKSPNCQCSLPAVKEYLLHTSQCCNIRTEMYPGRFVNRYIPGWSHGYDLRHCSISARLPTDMSLMIHEYDCVTVR